jgi:collagen triple helix repeat protein
MKNLFLTLVLITLSTFVFAQNVGINTTGAVPDASAALDIDYPNKGLLVPRVALLDTTDVVTIPAPATSLLVYNTNAAMIGGALGYWYWDGAAWVQALGPQGLAGPQGIQGIQGPIGLTGPQGIQGIQGPIGLTGLQGIQGIQGPIGPIGPSWTITSTNFNTSGTYSIITDQPATYTSPLAGWLTTGNAGIAAANFIGPTNNVDLKFRTNNTEKMTIEANGNVGINKITPTERLDVTGNVRFSGALMPNNQSGVANQMLLSGGAGTPPIWGQEMLNPTQTTAIGKYYSGAFNIPTGYLALTLTDANCVATSTCFISWPGNLPGGVDYGDVVVYIEAQAGQWIFYFANYTGFNLTNFEFSYVAYY